MDQSTKENKDKKEALELLKKQNTELKQELQNISESFKSIQKN